MSRKESSLEPFFPLLSALRFPLDTISSISLSLTSFSIKRFWSTFLNSITRAILGLEKGKNRETG
ncbi:hypothetical protein B296_00031049 [Ensete ventricosum]|uniref:Uncharacterized protein n=1 Tax=Ensete ventricosum TaxID=4639 RepID=A0A427AF83_ENSVE|nr:hypothetical protein B296_00031049 [Ensete ventricosum]